MVMRQPKDFFMESVVDVTDGLPAIEKDGNKREGIDEPEIGEKKRIDEEQNKAGKGEGVGRCRRPKADDGEGDSKGHPERPRSRRSTADEDDVRTEQRHENDPTQSKWHHDRLQKGERKSEDGADVQARDGKDVYGGRADKGLAQVSWHGALAAEKHGLVHAGRGGIGEAVREEASQNTAPLKEPAPRTSPAGSGRNSEKFLDEEKAVDAEAAEMTSVGMAAQMLFLGRRQPEEDAFHEEVVAMTQGRELGSCLGTRG